MNLARATPGQPTFDHFLNTEGAEEAEKQATLCVLCCLLFKISWFLCGAWRKFAQHAEILVVSSTNVFVAKIRVYSCSLSVSPS
jgi:hypothetical protein